MAAGFCPKNNGFARVWELQPPGSYAYAPEVHIPSVGFLFFFFFCGEGSLLILLLIGFLFQIFCSPFGWIQMVNHEFLEDGRL